MLDGSFGKEKHRPPTVAEFWREYVEAWSATHNKPSTVEEKRIIFERHLVPTLGGLRLDEIDTRRLDAYAAAKTKEELAAKTVNNHLAALRRMLSLAVEWGLLGAVPTVRRLRVHDPTVRFLDFDEANKLIAAMHREPSWQRMMLVAMRTGLRRGELIGLRWTDADLKAGRLVVRQAVCRGTITTPKSGRSREVPLCSSAKQALREHRHLRGPLVFCEDDGTMLKEHCLRPPLRRACKRAGIEEIGWHVLRHTFASHLVMRGVPLKVVQEYLGHSTIEITMRYAHLSPEVRRDAVDLLDLPPGGAVAEQDVRVES